MVMLSPQHFSEITNGYEQTSSGLWTHKGKAEIGSARITQGLPPNIGQGLELGHIPGPSGYGYVQAYDRDIAQYRDLYLVGKNISIGANNGGATTILAPLNLPANSVGTSQIQANAVQQYLGGIATAAGWSTTVTNTWVLTNVTLTVTSGGGMLRIEATVPIYHTVAGAVVYVGWALDGAVQRAAALLNITGVNYTQTVSFTDYGQPAAGSHTFAVAVFNATAGTLGINTASSALLYVTEQKR
jgi:hypothetical protein